MLPVMAVALAASVVNLVGEKRVSRRGENKTIYILKLIVLLLRFSLQLANGLPLRALLAASLEGHVMDSWVSSRE